MRGRTTFLVLAWALALAPVLSAQPFAQRRERRGGAGERREESQLRREEAFKMVDAYLVTNLQESLELSDEQFAKAIPLVKKLQASRRDFYLSRARLVRELRQQLQSGREAEVAETLRASKALEEEGPQRIRQDLAALDAVLTPLQQARYRVLEGEVERRIRELSRMVAGPRAGRQ